MSRGPLRLDGGDQERTEVDRRIVIAKNKYGSSFRRNRREIRMRDIKTSPICKLNYERLKRRRSQVFPNCLTQHA